MTENLLQNPGFNLGTWRKTHSGQEYGEITVPYGWVAYWDEDQGRPEMKVIEAVAPYLDPPRVTEPPKAVQWFTVWRTHTAGLYQHVSGLIPGARYRLSIAAHAWYSQRDDPHKSEYKDANDVWHEIHDDDPGMTFDLYVDLDARDDPWLPLENPIEDSATFYDGYSWLFVEFVATGADITVFIDSTADDPFKHCDAYVDDAYLERIDEPDECPTPPRHTSRTYNVIPQTATEARAVEIFLHGWREGKQTAGGSSDDAGKWGGIEDAIAKEWDRSEAEKPDYLAFYAEHYPGTQVVFMPEGVEPPDPPVDPGEPVPYKLREDGKNLLGLHAGFVRAQTENYVRYGVPTTHKVFSAGDAWWAKQWGGPDIVTVWRKFVGVPDLGDPLRDKARWYVDQYAAEVDTAARNMGLTVEQLLSGIDIMESANETIPTYAPAFLQRAVEYDVLFSEELHARFGDLVGPGVLCGAIGNPHESEVHYLIPAAQAAVKYNGFVCYHGYWTRNETTECIADYWQWHAGRWMQWDNVFRDAGVYPRYVSTEGGIVWAHECTEFNSGKGWKSCGPFDNYLSDMHIYQDRVKAWNAEHANRCAGMHIFGYGNWGWDDFELGDGEVIWMAAEFGNGVPLRSVDFSTIKYISEIPAPAPDGIVWPIKYTIDDIKRKSGLE